MIPPEKPNKLRFVLAKLPLNQLKHDANRSDGTTNRSDFSNGCFSVKAQKADK